MDDEDGEIALCTLSAFNLGAIEKLEDLEEMAELAVRALDALPRLSGLPAQGRQEGQHEPRALLGIGVINYAYYLAKNGARYSDGSGLALTHRTFGGDPVLPAEGLRATGPRVRPLPGLQRDHLCPGYPAHRYL